MNKLFSIGDFAKIADVSVQALRHYDKTGILKPHSTDEESSYRYYSQEQLFSLNNIKMLQSVGFTLQEIAELSISSSLPDLIDAYQQKAETVNQQIADLRKARKQLVWYQEILGRMKQPIVDVDENDIGKVYLREAPEHRLLMVRENVCYDYPSLLMLYNQLLKKLFEQRCKVVGGLNTVFYGGYHDIYHKRTDIALAFLLEPESKRGKKQPAQRYLSCLHKGKYPTSLETYAKLQEYAQENRFVLSAPVSHVLRVPIAAVEDPNATVFELRIPVSD